MTSEFHPLTCKELVELVTEYFEGALLPAQRQRFEAHLATCKGCQMHIEEMRKTIRILGTLTEDTIPPKASDELLRVFRAWKKS